MTLNSRDYCEDYMKPSVWKTFINKLPSAIQMIAVAFVIVLGPSELLSPVCLLFINQNLSVSCLGYKILKFKYSFADSLESTASDH